MIPRQVAGERVPGSGVMFVGTQGHMFADYGRYRLYPQDKFKNFQPPKQTIPKSIGHHAEWIRACKQGGETSCAFDYSGPLTETVLLGNVALRAGAPLTWDAEALTATDCPTAARYVRKTYRPGWELL